MAREAHIFGLVLALTTASATGAGAIIGGSEGGPLNNATLMVLSDRGGVCTGIILERDVVLTAGHCVAGTGQVRLHWRSPGEPVLKEPAAVVIHPGYKGKAYTERTKSVDLALIRLAESLPHTFAAATLQSRERPRKGEPLTVTGYGLARDGDHRSSGTYRAVGLEVVEPHGPGKILLWASSPAHAGACTGDSGGPMIARDDSVAAVTASTEGKGNSKCGGVMQGVLLAPQRAWIDATLQSWGRRANWGQ